MAGIFTAAGLLAQPATSLATQQVGPAWWGRFNPALMGPATGFTSPPSEWDVIQVGPQKQPLPGLARVKRCSRRMKLHRKEKPASDFEDQTFQGFSVLEFDFTLELASAAQLAALQNWLGYIFPGSGDPPNPLSSTSVPAITSTTNLVNPSNATARSTAAGQQIQSMVNTPKKPPLPVRAWHPLLALHGVTDLVFVSMDGPLPKSESTPDIFVALFRTVQFKPSRDIQPHTFKKTKTLGTGLGAGPMGLGVLQPQWLNPAQDPRSPPSTSGGANPTDEAFFSNLLRPLPGGQAGGATGGY